MKLTVLVESNKDLVLADGELNAVQQLQQKMLDDVKLMVDTNALLSWDETRRALADYEKFVKDTADRNREEEQRRARDVAANLAAANQKYFTHFGKKGVTSAAKVTEYLLKSYGDVVKAFFGGRTLSDVMGTSLGPVSDVDWAEEWKIYDKCGEGAGS
jgi:antitoxin component of MazEF toxin-antitoxin module